MNKLMCLDLECCYRAMENIEISGAPRNALIEEAIAAIQKDGKSALQTGYLGIKNYAGFGDQREDHGYGMCPRHGTIVFSIGRTQKARDKKTELGADEIYYLEAYREFGVKTVDSHCLYKKNYYYDSKENVNLGVILARIKELRELYEKYFELIKNTKFEFESM